MNGVNKRHIFESMKKWEPDKWKHFYVGIPLGLVLQVSVNYLFSYSIPLSVFLSFIALAAISYGFELLSLLTGKGHYDIVDAVAGIAGGCIGIALAWLIVLL